MGLIKTSALLIATAISTFSFAIEIKADDLNFAGLLKNRRTGDHLVMRCAEQDCQSLNFFLISQKENDQVQIEKLNQNEIKRDTLITQNSGNNKYDSVESPFVKRNRSNAKILPSVFNNYYGTHPGYWLELTNATWEFPIHQGLKGYLLMPLVFSVTPATAAFDITGTIIIDLALIVSYPIRALLTKDSFKWKRGLKLVRVLKNNENKKIKVISNRSFNKLATYLRNNF